VERGNPVAVRIRARVRQADRKEGGILRREQDGPRSQRRRPKGNGNPGQPLSPPLIVSHNRPDTGYCPDPKGC